MTRAFRIFFGAEDTRPWLVLLCLLLAGACEAVGLTTLLPVISHLADGGSRLSVAADGGGVGTYVTQALAALGLPTTLGVLITVMAGAMVLKSLLAFCALSYAGYSGAKVAAGYMTIRNKAASADRLVGVASAAAARVETHVTVRDGDIMRMREVQGYDIPAGGSFELKPGGPHLMFVDIKQPFREGERIPVTLEFEKAGQVRVEFPVARLTGQRHGH